LSSWQKVRFAKIFMLDNCAQKGWTSLFAADQTLVWNVMRFVYPSNVLPSASGGSPPHNPNKKARRALAAAAANASAGGRGSGALGGGGFAAPGGGAGGKGRGKGKGKGNGQPNAIVWGTCYSRSDPSMGPCQHSPGCKFNHNCNNCGADHDAASCPKPWDPVNTVLKP
jgi:hypothetical protein